MSEVLSRYDETQLAPSKFRADCKAAASEVVVVVELELELAVVVMSGRAWARLFRIKHRCCSMSLVAIPLALRTRVMSKAKR